MLKKKGLVAVGFRDVSTPIYTGNDRQVYHVDDDKAANGNAKLRIEAA